MKVVPICNAMADMYWQRSYTSQEFDQAVEEYAACGIVKDQTEHYQTDGRKVYVAAARRSEETARMLFGEVSYELLPSLDEAYPRSFADTKKRYPLWLWRVLAKVQSVLGIKRQPSSQREIKDRARGAVKMLTERGEDGIVICDAGMVSILVKEFGSAGYDAKRINLAHLK